MNPMNPNELQEELKKVSWMNYMPVMGRVRQLKYISPEEIQSGYRSFENEVASNAFRMRMSARHRAAMAQQKANEALGVMRSKMSFMGQTSEQRSLSRIRDFMVNKGRETRNYFGY